MGIGGLSGKNPKNSEVKKNVTSSEKTQRKVGGLKGNNEIIGGLNPKDYDNTTSRKDKEAFKKQIVFKVATAAAIGATALGAYNLLKGSQEPRDNSKANTESTTETSYDENKTTESTINSKEKLERFSDLMQTVDNSNNWDWKNHYSEAQVKEWGNEVRKWAPDLYMGDTELIFWLLNDYPYLLSLDDLARVSYEKPDGTHDEVVYYANGEEVDITKYKLHLIQMLIEAYWRYNNTFENVVPSSMWYGLSSAGKNPYYNYLSNCDDAFNIDGLGPIQEDDPLPEDDPFCIPMELKDVIAAIEGAGDMGKLNFYAKNVFNIAKRIADEVQRTAGIDKVGPDVGDELELQ